MSNPQNQNGATALEERPAPAAAETIPPAAANEAVTPAEPKKPNKKGIFVIAGVIIILAGILGYRSWSFAQSNAYTDDAYVDATTVQIIPQVQGNIAKILVDDNATVKKGQLLAVLDDRQYVAAVQQAQANLDAAIAAAQQAGVSVSLTQETGNAQQSQAQGIVDQAASGVSGARSDVMKTVAGIAAAKAGLASAHAQVTAAQSEITNAESARAKAVAALNAAESVVTSAQSQVTAAQANVDTAQANYAFAQKDAARFESLVAQGAVSQQQADEKATAAATAEAQLRGAQAQLASARANLAQQQANVVSARSAITSADAGIRNARANLQVAQSEINAQSAGVNQALAAQQAAQDNVTTAQAKLAQAEGQLAQANTAGTQVDVSKTARLEAMARVEQARASLAQAQLNLSYTRIYAPTAGRVTNKNIEIGQLVIVGTPIMDIVDESDIWVDANYKETQMDGIVPGKKVDVDVDAIPGVTFTGTVNSIQAGTGSAFALLPPDNASGNFTKVVQRIPVKVEFDKGQPHLDELREGMSAEATVHLK